MQTKYQCKLLVGIQYFDNLLLEAKLYRTSVILIWKQIGQQSDYYSQDSECVTHSIIESLKYRNDGPLNNVKQ